MLWNQLGSSLHDTKRMWVPTHHQLRPTASQKQCGIYHFCQQGAACINHEGVSEVDVAAVHLELQVAELRVVHHAAEVRAQFGQCDLDKNDAGVFKAQKATMA